MKYLSVLVDFILWFWLFIIPAGIAGFLAYNRYYHHPKNLTIPVVLFIIGIALGIFLAEIVRRKIGLNYFFSSIKASADFDKMNQPDEEKDDKKII